MVDEEGRPVDRSLLEEPPVEGSEEDSGAVGDPDSGDSPATSGDVNSPTGAAEMEMEVPS